MNNSEQTLSIIKPDAVERNLTEKIKEIFISKNLKIKRVFSNTLKNTNKMGIISDANMQHCNKIRL